MKKVEILVLATIGITLYILLGGYIQSMISNLLISSSQKYIVSPYFSLSPIITSENNYENEKLSIEDLKNLSKDGIIVTSDSRSIALKEFLIDYNSPMYPYADVFISEADKYGLDWRLVVSISGVESAFGSLIPYKSNNAWGWKGGPNGNFSNFSSWTEGIKTITQGLAEGYGTDLTPFDIEPTYCPPCGQNPQHLWANGVVKFMNQLDLYVKEL